MVFASAVRGLTRPIGGRAVHLKLVPRPLNMADTRQILWLLQDYGKVEMFKSLRYDASPAPNTMLAIFQSEESAQKLLRRSPLRFQMSTDDGSIEETQETQTSSDDTVDAPESELPMSSDRRALAEIAARRKSSQQASSSSSSFPSSRSRASSQDYQLLVNIAAMNHRDRINVNPYNGPFAVDTKSAVQQDLAKQVPMLGLSDVNLRKLEKPRRVLQWEKAHEGRQYRKLRQMLDERDGSTTPVS